jgi:hypothetical protein
VLLRAQDAVIFSGGGRSLVHRTLLATDANSKTLPARIELDGHAARPTAGSDAHAPPTALAGWRAQQPTRYPSSEQRDDD